MTPNRTPIAILSLAVLTFAGLLLAAVWQLRGDLGLLALACLGLFIAILRGEINRDADESAVLGLLQRYGPMTPQEIARQGIAEIEAERVIPTLARLEAQGRAWIFRWTDRADTTLWRAHPRPQPAARKEPA